MSEQENKDYTEAELAEMSRDEKMRLGLALDDVELVEYRDNFPVPDTRAERRAERSVAAWFVLAGLSGLAFIAVFLFWPWDYQPSTEAREHFIYSLYNPLIGFFLGLSILAVGIGVVQYQKKFIPHEVAVQQRHDGHGSSEVDRQTTAAILADAGNRSGIARRKMITRTAGFGLGAFGLSAGVFALGGMVRNPWAEEGQESLLHTGWMPEHPGEKIYLRRDTGNPHDVSLLRPEDIEAGGFETVFPFREAWRHDEEELITSMRKGDAPVMLIRLRPGSKPLKRKGQEDFNYGDYYAYSKICTHLGCPTSLFEQQTGRLLCPCHQSQFDVVNTYAKPVFGPATRALPQLPITVDEDGYFVAKGDFIEPVGPAYWERKS
ncbi:ubiquinol-cytochrome c reductase iron-sulfur subunit [Saccharopolyspora dendranthemae]|uniref:Cytochrome bc1 complex Rieske iron-sulfur subunit n=1 Tax=Saccharopolyspora dendranthemae TaxID=1181886 RepID=A0A561U476_9PSEU|nr:ubiquinol-cytochrome c reductase iron-sulfur subunit [Saccharopolyspora dendranthemae]TWF94166.1 menaquinol-cytochrome c reductase iron-sulfur subunit precursor [Saccharopolyspora dendranthemae]